MESRKLISFGSSSYVVSLPKNWVDSNKLGKGDSIYIEEKPNELLITIDSAEKEKEIREKQIDASGKSVKRIESEIVAAYLNTYDILEIRGIKDSDIPKIKEIIQNLAGLEILEQTANKIVARDLINVNEVSIKTLIRRVDIIVRSMIDDALSCLGCWECSDNNCVAQLDSRDSDVNRLTRLISRMAVAALKDPKLAKKFNTNPIEVMTESDLANRLERIGDHIKRLVRHVKSAQQDAKQFKEICRIFEVLKDKYLMIMKAYYAKDVQAAFEVETTAKELFRECDNLFENGPNKHTLSIITHLKNFMFSIKYAARAIILNSP